MGQLMLGDLKLHVITAWTRERVKLSWDLFSQELMSFCFIPFRNISAPVYQAIYVVYGLKCHRPSLPWCPERLYVCNKLVLSVQLYTFMDHYPDSDLINYWYWPVTLDTRRHRSLFLLSLFYWKFWFLFVIVSCHMANKLKLYMYVRSNMNIFTKP